MIWGHKTQALFDIWTFQHLLTGIFLSLVIHHIIIWKTKSPNIRVNKIFYNVFQKFDILTVLFFAYSWELLEYYFELGLFGSRIAYWFAGSEFWVNRFLFDPFIVLGGYILGKKYKNITIPATTLCVIWIIVSVFFFPHSMWLHEIL
jgi:hypothetical protein